ncbi:MAG: (2Fe-2S)-binding protein [Actinomycetota bacterium]|nr:(2Fe-2S)-binding protein [Actinomycetota bacterium]
MSYPRVPLRAMRLDPAAVLALRAARPAGSFFEVEFNAAGRGWVALAALGRDRMALLRRTGVARRAIARPAACVPGDIPLPVTASIDLLGLSARILSPVLAAVALAGVVPMLDDEQMWTRGNRPLAVTGASGRQVAGAVDAAQALYAGVVQPVLIPLVAAYRQEFGVSPRVLWGDVASALNGAATVLEASGLEQRIPVSPIVVALLGIGELGGTARSLPPGFVRNSCCLYYRVPGGRLCGDCVLAR